MTTHPKITVTDGQIAVNAVFAHVSTDDVIVIEADCASKYPELRCYGGTAVFLGAGERTLYAERDKPPTVIAVEVSGHWQVIADVGRYSVTIVLFRPQMDALLVAVPEQQG